jgi:hypothetical protein
MRLDAEADESEAGPPNGDEQPASATAAANSAMAQALLRKRW